MAPEQPRDGRPEGVPSTPVPPEPPRRRPRWYTRIPVLGVILLEALHADEIDYKRYREREDRGRRVKARVLSLLTILSGTAYIVWVALSLNPAELPLGILFLAAELACLGLFVLASSNLWSLRFKPRLTPPPARAWSIDVFVPVCGEPLPIVRKTLEAVRRIRWHGDLRPWVLDDGGSDELRELCSQLRVGYLSRRAEGVPQVDAKGGNLNFGLARTSADLILALDADQVPDPQILEVLAGYIGYPKVAFVQSRQEFLLPEEDPFFCEDKMFYGVVQLGMDNTDTVIACGSGVLYRREALDSIGGFATWNLVEDLTTSYELHSHGWKSLYYPYPLSRGLAPEDIWGVCKQRGQWALDTMRLFFWDNPLVKPGLSWKKRLNYFLIGYTYLCVGFFIPFFFVIPPWSYLTGAALLVRSEIEFAVFRGAYFVLMGISLRYLALGASPGRQFQMLIGLFPVYFKATVKALRYRRTKPGYHVNNQARKTKRAKPAALAVWPQLLLVAANLFGPQYAAWMQTCSPRLIAANAVVSAVAIWSLWQAIAAAVGEKRWDPQRHPSVFYGIVDAR